jgi:hypothetical protein
MTHPTVGPLLTLVLSLLGLNPTLLLRAANYP